MKSLNHFRGILFDVDLTLTNNQREITQETRSALAALAHTPLKMGVCTGRSLIAVRTYVLPLFPPESLHVTSDGTQLVNGAGDILWQSLLPPDTIRAIAELANKHRQQYAIPTPTHMYASPPMMSEYKGAHPLTPEFTPSSEIARWDNMTMIALVNPTPEFLVELKQHDESIELHTSIGSKGYFVADAKAKGMNKSVGLRQWCLHHDLDESEVIGIGDSNNDLEFLQAVGHPVAMGNATQEVLDRAARVIDHTDNNGVATYIRELLKGSPV